MKRIPLLLLLAALAGAQTKSQSGLDTAAMDRAADPCVNFYQYACGNWVKTNPLPADRSRWGRFTELSEHNEKILLDILQGAAQVRPGRSPLDQKIGDAYAACMDTATINKKGIEPIKPELDRIAALDSEADVVGEVIRLHRLGIPVMFSFGARPDAKDSSRTIASVGQGGLSLPDRDYYLKTDPKSAEIRKQYLKHVQKMFELAGDTAAGAEAKAALVMEVENILANASMDRVSLRDPNKSYHMMTRAELTALTGNFPWDQFFAGVGAPAFEKLNVSQPDFLRQISANLSSEPIEAFRAYFAYHVLRASAQMLSDPFENESFDFWGRYLTGAKEQRPRAARCVAVVDRQLGDLLGEKYIELAFGADAKTQINQMVDAIEKSMGNDINTLPWMTAETKKAALAKLKAITNNIGAPKKWRDYSKITIARDDYYGNALRTTEAMLKQRIDKIGQATDKSEWMMTTPTVNAFYSPQNNTINFPAGILQSPFFDPRRDVALNYGGAGVVIGHELTHGFDDQGRKFDGDGNLRDWWTPADGAEFDKRAACIANEYSGFTAVDDVKLNGRLTLGENTADNGGLRIALMALHDTLAGNGKVLDGFTPEQRFFLGFAQIWCENVAPQEARSRAMTDPHSPGRYRVNGTLQNSPEFQKAFSCKAGQPMVSADPCRVW
ncbi:MAG: M13 family metallopeptidase [Acidobacteria bacterium]|nr:M13 family metallopeptidase [Acidobacteriota bacterium]